LNECGVALRAALIPSASSRACLSIVERINPFSKSPVSFVSQPEHFRPQLSLKFVFVAHLFAAFRGPGSRIDCASFDCCFTSNRSASQPLRFRPHAASFRATRAHVRGAAVARPITTPGGVRISLGSDACTGNQSREN
jgi:hypothetical protein